MLSFFGALYSLQNSRILFYHGACVACDDQTGFFMVQIRSGSFAILSTWIGLQQIK